MERFFKIVFGIMLLCLVLCVAQLARIEYGYEIANFLENRKIITLSPRQVARQYILALKKKDYKVAYNYLTPDTQERFSLADFVLMNKGSMTIMDENKTWIYWKGVMVGMQIYEDPGSWGYLLVNTNGKWKLIIRGGIPSFPFIKDYFRCCH